jgi:cytochrome c peroxidase
MPEEYKELDIAEYVLGLCTNEVELQRVGHELLLYQEKDLFNLLRYLKYLVDVMTENKVIWGVGRGSSVASFDVTKAEADKYMFKVPMLRNVTETGPYFHNGAISDLQETIKIMGQSELNKTLTPEEIANIAAFLKALKGNISDEAKKAPVLPGV